MRSETREKTRTNKLLIVVLMTMSASLAHAVDRGTVRGHVLDEVGRPLANAAVIVVDIGLETISDNDGSFEITGVPAGTHRVEARLGGFSIDTVDALELADGELVELDFQLFALPVPLKEVVVTSSVSILREEPVTKLALDRKDIAELPHFGDDLYRAVTVLPGVSGGDISARFSIRGGLHSEILVALDGQELFEPFHLKDFQGVFSIFDPAMIGGLEMHPGGFSSEYGDRMTGVLDMSSMRPDNTRHEIGISFSNAWFNTGGTFANGKGRWLGSARRGYLDIVLDFVEDDDDDGAPPDPEYWDAYVSLGFDPSTRHSLTLQLLAADDNLLFEEDEVDEYLVFKTGYDSSYLWLRHTGVVGPKVFVNSSIYLGNVGVDREIFGFDDPPEVFELDDVRDMDLYGIKQDWEIELSERQYLRAGFELRSYDVSYDYESNSVIEDPVDDPRFEPGTRITSFHDTFEGEWHAVYASDRLRFSDRVTAELGARFDRQTLTDDDQISPRLNLLLNVGPTGLLRFGWGHFYQSQRPYELAVQFGETEFFDAQKAEHFSAGFETDLGSRHSLRVDAYLRDVSDPHERWETLFDPWHPAPEIATDVVQLRPESVTAKGVETYVGSRRGSRFDWWLSYTWSEITDELPLEGGASRFNDQTHALTASATWRPGPKWSLTGVWTYHTGWPTTSISAELVPAPGGGFQLSYDVGPFYHENNPDYHRLDFRASRTTKVGKGSLTLFIDVQNLYNRDNVRGIAIADPEYNYNSSTGSYIITFPEENWLPVIPSFGISYEF
jgi:hypothetical protein